MQQENQQFPDDSQLLALLMDGGASAAKWAWSRPLLSGGLAAGTVGLFLILAHLRRGGA